MQVQTPIVVLGIDPGSEQSAWVLWDGKRVLKCGTSGNTVLLVALRGNAWGIVTIAVEGVEARGAPLGNETRATCEWAGRFSADENAQVIYPKDIRRHFCGISGIKRMSVYQVIEDRAGGKGTVEDPGPLHGIISHLRDALAVAVMAHDLLEGRTEG